LCILQLLEAIVSKGIPALCDVTKREESGEVAQQPHDKLEDLVAQRTAELITAHAFLREQIAERKCAEEALRHADEKYRVIFENALDGIFQSTPDGQFISANPALARMFGYESVDEFIADRTNIERQHYIDPDRREIFKKLMAETGIVQNFELQAYRKDGSIIWTSENGRAVCDATGSVVYYEGIVEDITPRKQAEAERVRLSRRLVTAQEDERRRISRELHDQMGQSLAALMLGLKSLQDSGQFDSEHFRLQQLQDLTNQVATEVHTLARELRPTALDDLGLHTALWNYVEEWSDRCKVPVDFHSNGLLGPRLPGDIETTVYRLVQEALTNVMKHAKAQNVSVIVECRANRVLVIVEDDGPGFDAEALRNTPVRKRRLGLLGMQERVELVGGNFNIESTPGVGTTVLAHIPVSNDQADVETGE
jgi:PAS domain S-box-containing protein